MAIKLLLPERAFLQAIGNHREFGSKLSRLNGNCPELDKHAEQVTRAWISLGKVHLREARKASNLRLRRSALSRAYYAAYNASKGVRYAVTGAVSLKGDDHQKAATDLPSDFPDVAAWSVKLGVLYENRLHADYDNWSTTSKEFSLKPDQAVEDASAFLKISRAYLKSKFGLDL